MGPALLKTLHLETEPNKEAVTMALMLVLFLLYHRLDHIELFTEHLLCARYSVYVSSSDSPNTFLTKSTFFSFCRGGDGGSERLINFSMTSME